VNDPSFGAILLSQFGTATVFEPGVSVSSMSVTQAVPEPSAVVLAGLGIAAAGLGLQRRLAKRI